MTPAEKKELISKAYKAFIEAISTKGCFEASDIDEITQEALCGEAIYDPFTFDNQAFKLCNTLGFTIQGPGWIRNWKGQDLYQESVSSHSWDCNKATRYAIVFAITKPNKE